MTNLGSVIQSRDIILPIKVHYIYVFSSSCVQIWELDHKEGWVLKNWYFWILVLEKTLESPLDCKEIEPVNPKGNQSWIFIGSTDAEAEALILWWLDVKNWLISKDPDAGKDWRQEEKLVRLLDRITDSMDMNLSKLQETVEDREAWWESIVLQRVKILTRLKRLSNNKKNTNVIKDMKSTEYISLINI